MAQPRPGYSFSPNEGYHLVSTQYRRVILKARRLPALCSRAAGRSGRCLGEPSCGAGLGALSVVPPSQLEAGRLQESLHQAFKRKQGGVP